MKSKNNLEQFILSKRKKRLQEVLDKRTASLTLVVDSFHKEHNIDAVLRTCEAFGMQHVHVIPQSEKVKPFQDITQGADRWLTIHYYETAEECIRLLKEEGFKILAGSFEEGSVPLRDCDFTGKIALIFGNEVNGASETVIRMADGLFVIPLVGFSQSLNVSVAAGITIHHVRQWKENRKEKAEALPENENRQLMERWINKSVKHADTILDVLSEDE